jgi:hypothetical protein
MFEPIEKLEVAPVNGECLASGAAATVASEGCVCRLAAGSQNGLSTVEEVGKEGPPKTITTKIAAKSVKHTKTKDGFLCPFSGTGEKANGTMTTNALSKAYTLESGPQANLFIGEAVPTSLCEVTEVGCKSRYGAGTNLEATAGTEPAFSFPSKASSSPSATTGATRSTNRSTKRKRPSSG